MESLNKCIDDLQKPTKVQDRALQEVQHEFVESRREQARLQEELTRKENALRDTQNRSMHEMDRMKRAQVQQVDEMSIQKLRENNETYQQLTSQLQQFQEQMNSMNSSTPPPTSKLPEDREFVIDSGASVHMLSKKVLSSDEIEALRGSRTPTMVVTANGGSLNKRGSTSIRSRS